MKKENYIRNGREEVRRKQVLKIIQMERLIIEEEER